MTTLELLFDLLTDTWVILGLAAIAAILIHEWRDGNRRVEDQRAWEDETRQAFLDEQQVVWLEDGRSFTASDLRRQREHARSN
jgi:hypothetical protein